MRVMKKDIVEDVGEIATAQEDAASMQKAMLAELKALRAELAAAKGGGAA
jgi:hypothetical protein